MIQTWPVCSRKKAHCAYIVEEKKRITLQSMFVYRFLGRFAKLNGHFSVQFAQNRKISICCAWNLKPNRKRRNQNNTISELVKLITVLNVCREHAVVPKACNWTGRWATARITGIIRCVSIGKAVQSIS